MEHEYTHEIYIQPETNHPGEDNATLTVYEANDLSKPLICLRFPIEISVE